MGFLGYGHEELRSFMSMHWPSICITTLVGATALGGVRREHPLIMKEAVPGIRPRNRRGTLPELKWNDFCQVAAID